MDELLQKVAQYGYPGLFAALMLGIAGLPVPDETLLVFSGYLAAKGKLQLPLLWVTGVVGSMCGISLSYAIGRWAGVGFVHRWGRYVHITEERLQQVQNWFDRIGHWLLTFGYYIPGVRHFTALVAGMSCLNYGSFAAFAYSGAVLWVSTFIALGYFVGDHWEQMLNSVHRAIFVVAAVALLGLWVAWKIRVRRKQP